MEVRMEYYLILAAVMFFAGVYGFITRRNLIAVLISIELILNAVFVISPLSMFLMVSFL